MAHEVRTGPLPATGIPVAGERDGGDAFGRVDTVLEGLWHLLTSMRVAMVIILAIAVLGVIGALIVQAPPGVLADPEAKANWLNEVRPKYGGFTGLLDGLQLFQIFSSVLFRVLVAGLTISLVACSAHRIPGVWRTATKPRVDVGPAFFEHAPQHEAVVVRHTPAETAELVTGALKGHRYRATALDDGAIHLYADRFRWTPVASLAGHLSLVVILAGAVVGSTFGYTDSQFTLAEGATRAVGAQPGLDIKLVDFSDTYYATTGAPSDYASQVVLYKGGNEVARHTIRVNDPLTYDGTTFYQAFFGSAAVMTVKDASGKTLLSEGVPLAWRGDPEPGWSSGRPLGSFSLPEAGLVGWAVGTLGSGDTAVKPGQMRVELYKADGGEKVDAKVVDQGTATTVGSLNVTFERESQFTGLNIARDPGVILVWIGGFLLFVGFVITFFLPHRRVWARIVARPGGGAVLAVASLARRDAALGTEFDRLVNDIRTALQAPARS